MGMEKPQSPDEGSAVGALSWRFELLAPSSRAMLPAIFDDGAYWSRWMPMKRMAQRFFWASFDVGWIGAFGWLAACLILLATHGALVVAPWNYRLMTAENGWVENFTPVEYLLAGAFLFAAAYRGGGGQRGEARRAPRFVFLAGGLGMAFIAGEEISWGQHILEFPTPDFFWINGAETFDVHTMLGSVPMILGHTFRLFIMLLCLTTAAALFTRNEGLFGVSLPSLPLLLLLCSIPMGRMPEELLADDKTLRFWFALFGSWQVALLSLLAAWALFRRRPALLLAAAGSAMLFFSSCYAGRQNIDYLNNETTELLWGLFWLCYAGELLHGARRRATGSVAPPPRLQASGEGAFPIRPAVSWLALAGGAGLLALAHFNVRMGERPGLGAAALQAVRSAEPDIRAEWDLHLNDGQLIYFKEPCHRVDADAGRFFLHIIPKEKADLPGHRKRHGFENLDFFFNLRGTRIEGSCMVVASLPDYPIASIRTGQIQGVPTPDAQEHLWKVQWSPVAE